MTDGIDHQDSPGMESRFAGQLERLISSLQASGRAVLPRNSEALLYSIVEAAAHIFGAAAASIALVNHEKGVLEFKVAIGEGNADIIGKSFPLGKGIAGYVAMTGQPLAVSNVEQDPRFAQDFAKSTGYVPRSILAAPLLSNDRVIGVMEVLDKIQAASFGMQDMELLSLFARQAALAIDQAQHFDRLGEALILGLERLAASDTVVEGSELVETLRMIDPERLAASDMLALADLFNQISGLGSAEQRACIQVLTAFAEYSRTREKLSRGGFRR